LLDRTFDLSLRDLPYEVPFEREHAPGALLWDISGTTLHDQQIRHYRDSHRPFYSTLAIFPETRDKGKRQLDEGFIEGGIEG
jgi:hypothetical protein